VERNEWPPDRRTVGKGGLAEVMVFVDPLLNSTASSAEADEKRLVGCWYTPDGYIEVRHVAERVV
jgi:hypothetical protein